MNKWAAEQCGVELSGTMVIGHSPYITLGSQWNLEDPRCMQLFREKVNISTVHRSGVRKEIQWTATARNLMQSGSTIQEAELSCAKALYEGLHYGLF